MLPHAGERYLSTPLFESIPTMNEEEQEIACSVYDDAVAGTKGVPVTEALMKTSAVTARLAAR